MPTNVDARTLTPRLAVVLAGLFAASCTGTTPEASAFASKTADGEATDSSAARADVGQPDTSLDATGGGGDAGADGAGSPDSAASDTAGKPDTGEAGDAGGGPDTGAGGGCTSADDCDDGKACTIDLCNPSDGTCGHKPHTGACDDGDPCTLADQCGKDGKCHGPVPTYARRLVAATKQVDGGHLAVGGGITAVAGASGGKPMVSGIDATGKTAWQTPAVASKGGFDCIAPLKGGGFVLGGWKATGTGATQAALITRVGANGVMQGQASFPSQYTHVRVRGVAPTANADEVFIAGEARTDQVWGSFYGRYDLSTSKVVGKLTLFGSAEQYRGVVGLLAADTQSLVFGWASPAKKAGDGWLSSHDPKTGALLFEETYGAVSSYEYFQAATQLPDQGLLLAGSYAKDHQQKPDVWLVKTDKLGKQLWSKVFGSDGTDIVGGVLPAGTGALVVGTREYSSGASPAIGSVWRVDAWGNLLWQRATNKIGAERLVSVVAGPHATVVGGHQVGTPAGGPSFIALWMDAYGHVTCGESGVCAGKPFGSCDDGKPCTVDLCEPGTGCVHKPLAKDAPCGATSVCDGSGGCG